MFQPRMTASELGLVARTIWLFGPDEASFDPTRAALAEHFATELERAKVNSQFDRARFIRAATTGENTKEATR